MELDRNSVFLHTGCVFGQFKGDGIGLGSYRVGLLFTTYNNCVKHRSNSISETKIVVIAACGRDGLRTVRGSSGVRTAAGATAVLTQ